MATTDTADADPWRVTLEAALARLVVIPDYDPGGDGGSGPCVHTFRSSPIGPIGAHRRLADVRAAIERFGVREAGPQAASMGHGLVVIDASGPVFLASHPPQAQQEGAEA